MPRDQLDGLFRMLAANIPISEEAWAAAEPMFVLRRFDAGAHLFKAGEVVTELFFVAAGLARFYYLDAKGREFNKSFSGPGQVLSSISSLVTGGVSPFFVQALAPTQAFSMCYTDFQDLVRRFPDWMRLRMTLLEQLVIKRERREADLLLLSATERYQKFLDEYSHLSGVLPNYHIASYLGITEVALSRIRRRLGLTQVNAPITGLVNTGASSNRRPDDEVDRQYGADHRRK